VPENRDEDVDGHLAFGVSDTIRAIGDSIHDFNDIATPAQNASATLLRCHDYVYEFNGLVDYEINALRDITWADFLANKDKIDPEAAQRALHVVGEIHRVEEGVKLLAEGQLEAFGQFMFD
jgi:galactokinase